MNIKFTNKIPDSAISQKALAPKGFSKQASVNGEILSEILNRSDLDKKLERNEEEDLKKMAIVSPQLKQLLKEEKQIKRASVSSTDKKEREEAIRNSQSSRSESILSSGTVKQITGYDDMLASTIESHSLGEKQFSNKSETLFTEIPNVMSMSDVSKIDILTKKQMLLSKNAKNMSSEEIAEQQKSRKTGSYNEITGMYDGSIIGSKNIDNFNEHNFDAYKMFSKKTIAGADKDIKKLAKELKSRLMQNLSKKLNQTNDWRANAQEDISNRISKASTKANKLVEDFYSKRSEKKVFAKDDFEEMLSDKFFNNRMKSLAEEKSSSTKQSRKERKERISRNIKEAQVMTKAKVNRPTQTIVDKMATQYAKKSLKDNGFEEI